MTILVFPCSTNALSLHHHLCLRFISFIPYYDSFHEFFSWTFFYTSTFLSKWWLSDEIKSMTNKTHMEKKKLSLSLKEKTEKFNNIWRRLNIEKKKSRTLCDVFFWREWDWATWEVNWERKKKKHVWDDNLKCKQFLSSMVF